MKKKPSAAERKAMAAILGRLGGLKGGPKGGKALAAKLTPEERRASARRAVQARWAKVRAAKKKATKP